MKSLILASGFGTRLYPFTISKAKALLEHKGIPLITHIVDKIPEDIEILVNINRKFESDFRQWQESIKKPVRLCVEDVWTDKEKLGAIGSLDFWIKENNIKEDLLVIAGDNYFEFALADFIAAYDGYNTLVAIHDIGDREKAKHFGVVQLGDNNRIAKLEEKPNKPVSSIVSTACYIFPPRVFSYLSECGSRDNLGNLIAYIIDNDRVNGYLFLEDWFDVGDMSQTIKKVPVSQFTNIVDMVKKSEKYQIYDLTVGRLVISMTVLNGLQSTVGHSHNHDEIYLFFDGQGEIHLDDRNRVVSNGDIVLIPGGAFHGVSNKGQNKLTFLCFFEGKRDISR